MLLAALVGFLVGFLGSVPVAGPIAALVVTRGVQGRFRSGAFIALGGGVAEAAYAFLAFWGFSRFLTDYPLVVPLSRAAAAIILLVLGIVLVRFEQKEPELDARPVKDSAIASFFVGASICALNPTLIATWTAVVASLYSAGIDMTTRLALPFAAGACAGIAGWFGCLLAIIRRSKDRFSAAVLERLVRGIGVFLLLVAGWFAWRLVSYFVA